MFWITFGFTLFQLHRFNAGDYVRIIDDVSAVKKAQAAHGGWQDSLSAVSSCLLTHICLVEPSIFINWTSPFQILVLPGVLFHFYSIDIPVSKQ